MLYFLAQLQYIGAPNLGPYFYKTHLSVTYILFPFYSHLHPLPPPIAIGLEKEGAGRLSSDGMTPGRTSLDRMEDREAKLRTRVGEA